MASSTNQTRLGGDRSHQAFPELDAEQIARMRPFAEERSYADGEVLFEAGAPGPGLFIVTRGEVAITRRDGLGGDVPIVNQGPGHFLTRNGHPHVVLDPPGTRRPPISWRGTRRRRTTSPSPFARTGRS